MMASKDLKKASKEEISLIEERIRLGVEYIFARALIPILDSLTFHKSTLDPAFCEEIEDIAFSFFKAPKKAAEDVQDESVLGNRKKIPTLYAKVVGILSETRFTAIYPKFLKATTDTPVRSKKATFVLLGVRYIRFLMETPEGVEQSIAFLNSLFKLFKAAQPIEVKQAIAELIVRLLRAAICNVSSSCDYSPWYAMLLETYITHAYHPKKGKYNKETVALIPMVTAILCSLRKADFLEHYREWLSRLYAAIKEYKTRTVALESILFVVEIFYLKVGNELQSALHLLLEEVGSIVLTYCTLKRPMNDKGDMLDIFVDIVHAMAQLSLNYAIEDVILKLLAFTNTPAPIPDTTGPTTPSTTPASLTGNSFLPFTFSSAPNPYAFACEKVIIAVRATVQLRLGETSSNEKTSKRLFTMSPKDLLALVHSHLIQGLQSSSSITITPAISSPPASLKDSHLKDKSAKEAPKDLRDSKEAKSSKDAAAKPTTPTIVIPISPGPVLIPPFYNTLASREAQLSALNPYWDNVTTIWAQILLHLDSVLGHLLYSTSYKTLYDMIRPERDVIAIQLLQLLLQSIPTVVPKLSIPKLVSILAKYIIHLDKGIEEMSTGALTRLMTWRPDCRPLIISGLADFSTTLSHNRNDLIFTLLFKLGQLFKQWLDIVKPPFELPRGSRIPPSTAADLDNFPVTKIEGIALIFLCSSTSKIRLLSLEILKSVRAVESLLRKTTGYAPPSRNFSSVPIISPSTRTVRGPYGPASPYAVPGDVPLSPTRIMDIIDEAGPDIIRSLQSDSKHFSIRSIPPAVKTIERLAAKDTREDQWLWSSVLGELLRYFVLLQPEPALLAAYLIQSRLREVKPDDKEIAPDQEEMLYWWRNYITLECVVLVPHFLLLLPPILTITSNVTSSGSSSQLSLPLGGLLAPTDHHRTAHLSRELSSSSSTGTSKSETHVSSPQVMLPKDVFAMILPYLRSNNDMLREASVMALQRTNFASAEVLTDSLRSFEKEFQGDHSDKKRKQKRNRLRLEVTSIYTSIVESIHQTALCRNTNLRRHLVYFLGELQQHLKSNRNLFDMLQLRYQYCVIVSRLAEELHAGTVASKDFHQSKEEITLRKNAFQLLSTWCSSDIFQDEATKKHLNSLLSTIKDAEKRKAYINALREHIMVLQFSALTAMSSCLKGPQFDEILTGDQFFDFVDGFLRHSLDKVQLLARFMLESFLSGNISQPHVLHTTLNKSYHTDPDIANQYFLCLVTLFPEEIIFACSEVTLLHLIVYMIGNSDFHVRRAARELLLMLKSLTNSDEQWLTTVPFVVDSSLPENYERAQLDLSVRLADFHPESAPEMITEMVIRLDMVAPSSKRLLLRSIVPWIEKLEFHAESRQVLDSLMENLLFVTVKYKQDFPREVEQLWTTVARTNRNLQVVIRELISIAMVRQNTEIIPLAKFVCIYLARTASKVVIDTLVSELSAGELAISAGSRRNTLTHSDRPNLGTGRRGTLGGNAKGGASSLGGSQSNSQASVTSLTGDLNLDDEESIATPRARAKSDASSFDQESTERPRSQTTGERNAPMPSPLLRRRLSIENSEKDTIGIREAAVSISPLSTMRGDTVAAEPRNVSDPQISKKPKSTKLAPSDHPSFDPAETTNTPSVVKVRSSRSKSRKRRRNAVPSFSTLGSSDDEDSSGTSSAFGVHPFQKLIPTLTEPWGLTRAHFILTILAQLTYETSEQFRDHLPIIFQLAFLGIDFPNLLVYEHCRIILLNVIHSLIVLPLEQIDNKNWALQEKYSEALHLVEYLRANQGEPLWAHEDVTMKKPEIRSASQLTSLVQAIIKAFSPINRPATTSGSGGDLAETWATQALTWAVHGQSWHITGRSFQIYRALRPAITRDAQNDLLECLLRSMSTKQTKRRSSRAGAPTQTRENLALTIEVLITLQTLVRAQSSQKLILFPQMFWTSVALLHTDYEQHYVAALKLLSDLLDRLDLSDTYVQNVFSASIPREWQPPFRGIQHLVARGLFSPMGEHKAIDVLSKLILIPFDRLLHPEPGRLLHIIICLLPFVCSNMRSSSGSQLKRLSTDIAVSLSQACAQERYSDLSRIFSKLSCSEYETIEEFVWEFRRPFGNALSNLQVSVLNGTYRGPDGSPYILPTPFSAATATSATATPSKSAPGTATSSPNGPAASVSPNGAPPAADDDTQSATDSGAAEQKLPFFRLESALAILFNILECSSSSWRRATLLIILALLQHRYPPPSSHGSLPGSLLESTARSSGESLRVPSSNASNDGRRLSLGVLAPEPLERVMQPSWLVTLLKQMSSSSWQQALLILDLALQHSAITVSELDPFVLKSSKAVSTATSASAAASDIDGSSGTKPQQEAAAGSEFFCNRSSVGVASSSLALDKILSTEHRKRNLTLDPSVLSMFDGWYSKETPTPPPKSLRSKKLSSVAELDSDVDESISTEDQISYLLQTESKGSSAKADPFDSLAAPGPSSTLGRFPTFRGFDELLSKLESMPSTPMATLDAKPSGLFPDALSDGNSEMKSVGAGIGASGEYTVIRKTSSKKIKAPIKSIVVVSSSIESTGSETTDADDTSGAVTASSSAAGASATPSSLKLRTPRRNKDYGPSSTATRASLSSSAESFESDGEEAEEARRFNSHKFRLGLEQQRTSNKYHGESQGESSANESDAPVRVPSSRKVHTHKKKLSGTPPSSTRHNKQRSGSPPGSMKHVKQKSGTPPGSSTMETNDRSALGRAATLGRTHAAGPSSSRSGSSSLKKRSKTSTPSSTSSKYPSGASDEQAASPAGSGRNKKLEFSFSSELLTRTKRWRAALHREASTGTDPTTDELPALFKIFSSAAKLLTSLRADFRSCLTLYCRLVVPTNQSKVSRESRSHDPNAPHRALSELLSRMNPELEGVVPPIPEMMLEMMPLKYKRTVKRDVSFATAFRDQRTKFIEDVQQCHLGYTEQRVAAENIKSKLQHVESELMDAEEDSQDRDEQCLTIEKLAIEFALAILHLHVLVLNTLLVQVSAAPIVSQLLESYSADAVETARDIINAEISRSRSLISNLQSNLITLS